jgi:hypothetical protein
VDIAFSRATLRTPPMMRDTLDIPITTYERPAVLASFDADDILAEARGSAITF